MKYRFRRGALTGDERIEITDTTVKRFKGKGEARLAIAFTDVKEIHEYSNMSMRDESGGTFESHITRIVPNRGWAMTIYSTSFMSNGTNHRQVAVNHAEKYIKVLDTIKQRVANANPDAVLVSGNRIASVMGYICSFAGIAMLGFCAAAVLFGRQPFSKTWPLLLVGSLVGLIFTPWGIQMGRGYAPIRVPLRRLLSEIDSSVTWR